MLIATRLIGASLVLGELLAELLDGPAEACC